MRIYMQKYRTREYKDYLNMRIQCPICNKMTARTHIARHQKSELCKRIKDIKNNVFKECEESQQQITNT